MSRRRIAFRAAAAWAALLIAAGCTAAADVGRDSARPSDGPATPSTGAASSSSTPSGGERGDQRPPGEFTLALAGDVNFSERTAARLDDPATAFAEAAAELSAADLTMVNLETAIAVG